MAGNISFTIDDKGELQYVGIGGKPSLTDAQAALVLGMSFVETLGKIATAIDGLASATNSVADAVREAGGQDT